MLKLKYKINLLTIFFLGIISFSQAEPIADKVVYNLSQNWLRYDKYYEAYLPIKNSQLKTHKSIHSNLSFEKYKNYNLNFEATVGLTLFANNKLIYKKISGDRDTVQLRIHKLEPNKEGEVIITFYHPEGELPFYTAYIGNRVVEQKKMLLENNSQTLSRNTGENFKESFILFLIIASLFILFKQLYPKEYLRYYSFRVIENADHLLPGVFSIPSLWMAIINGLILSLLASLLKMNEIMFSSPLPLWKSTLYTMFFYMVFFIGKYIYLSGTAWLFNYSKIVTSQFAESIRLFEMVCVLASIVLFGIEASGFIKINISPTILYYSLILLLIMCVIKVIFLFFRLITHRNLYLFSYLCAAEMLPLIITIKVLLF